jgi:hypothetical protein
MVSTLFAFVYTSVRTEKNKLSQVCLITALFGSIQHSILEACTFPSVSVEKISNSINALNAYASIMFCVACAHFCAHRIQTEPYAYAQLISNFSISARSGRGS